MGKSSKIFAFILLIILAGGLIAALVGSQHSTENRQHASTFEDLNTADEITSTNNSDGTMGPPTVAQDFSNLFPAYYLGQLELQVTDPDQGKRPSITPHASVTEPTESQDQNQRKLSATPGTSSGGPQSVTSLVLSLSAAEVHLAHIALPGQKDSDNNDSTHPTGKPSTSPTPKSNQNVDKWEKLDISTSSTLKTIDVDLVQLAKTHDFAKLGLTKLLGGRYTEIRLYVAKAVATLADGTKITLTIPGRANIVRIVRPFVIVSGQITTLSIDFDAQNSVIKAGNSYILKPVVARFETQQP